MDCSQIQNENIIERYLAGTLPPKLRREWEEHYFGCAACAEALTTWQAIETPLRDAAPAIRREIAPSRRTWVWAGAGIAAMLAVALVTRNARQPLSTPPPANAYVELASLVRLEPAAYEETTLRGVETPGEALFRKAMRAYRNRDWTVATEGLRSSLKKDPEAAAPRFFLGVTLLLSGQPAHAVKELATVAAGTSPFATEARFRIAQGWLLLNREPEARAALAPLVAANGDFTVPARELLARLDARH
jgi:anti-sigma factor RsiW